MAINTTHTQRFFFFENANGTLYRVVLDVVTGVGYGEVVSSGTGSNRHASSALTGKTTTALAVDAGSLTGLANRHESWFVWKPVFNTAKALSQILTV